MGGPQVIDRAGEIAVVVDPDDLHAGYELLRCVYELADAEDSRPVVVDLTGCRLVDAAMLRAIGHAVRHRAPEDGRYWSTHPRLRPYAPSTSAVSTGW
jgi:hypothetical protein